MPSVQAPLAQPQAPSPQIPSVVPTHATGMLPAQTLLHNRYLIVKKIAVGGMGAVYKATDTRRQGQVWAIKEMSETNIQPGERAEAVASFQNEAATLSRLRHVNLPSVEETFEDQSRRHYMVMEFIDGQTLKGLLDANGGKALPESDVLNWAAQLCDVLEYLHNQPQPIIYRDLKPENVMIERATGCLKLIDFGIVRFYKAGKAKDTAAFGTQGYAPPEQSAAQTDARSDIYALGATLHHLLTGRDPRYETPWDFPPARKINPSVSAKVDAALTQALQVDRNKRPQDMAGFRSLLGVKSGRSQAAAKPQPAVSSKPQSRPGVSQPLVSTRKLDFGTVPRGQQPTRKLQVHGTTALVGSVAVTQAWLQVSPDHLKSGRTEVDVTVDTSQLSLGRSVWSTPNLAGDFWQRLEPYVRRYWWVMLIGLIIPYINLLAIAPFVILVVLALVQGLIWWTFLHASWLVREPCQHTAQVEVQTGAGSETVDVAIEVTPDPVENRWRWVASGSLVAAELAVVFWMVSSWI